MELLEHILLIYCYFIENIECTKVSSSIPIESPNGMVSNNTDLLYALHRPGLCSSSTGLGAFTEFTNIPPRWTWILVTGPDFYLQPFVWVTEVGSYRSLLITLHTDHYGLLLARSPDDPQRIRVASVFELFFVCLSVGKFSNSSPHPPLL